MFSSEDEQQDDNSVFDQLRSIRPFTIEQLYLLHPDVGSPQVICSKLNEIQLEEDRHRCYDRDTYQNLTEYEQFKEKLSELRKDIKQLHRSTSDHVNRAWKFKEQSTRKIGMCQQGKIAETTFKYKQAYLNPKQLEEFSLGISQLSEIIAKEYIYYAFESRIKRNKIATQFSIAYQISDLVERRMKLQCALYTLLEFIKNYNESKSDFLVQCRKWFRSLAKRYLEDATIEEYKFMVAQIARGPVGTADWSADLIECKPFDQVNGFESVPQYITHCTILLTELFVRLRFQIKAQPNTQTLIPSSPSMSSKSDRLNQDDTNRATDSATTAAAVASDQNWSLVDPRFSCCEELNISAHNVNMLSETDVIKLCLKIPVAQIFRAYVKKCLSSEEFRYETDKNYEYLMLKLLTIGTIIIKSYQTGLETFNSIQYGSLIEYLSSQIRRTVIILTDQWTEFKCRLKGIDDALLMRLQVEYDNFILRSILIILELRQSGIWRHLSSVEPDNDRQQQSSYSNWSTETFKPALGKLLQVAGLSTPPDASVATMISPADCEVAEIVPADSHRPESSGSLTHEFSVEWFREVSESMLWHILWQFYHNAFVSSCDYHSDNYWLKKFQDKSVNYLFVNKIRDSAPGECNHLLNSMTSMLLSRTRSDLELVNFIAVEIFKLSFKNDTLCDKITAKGTSCLIRCAEKFPSLISMYLSLISDGSDVNPNEAHPPPTTSAIKTNEYYMDLIKGCSLNGWVCNSNELALASVWLTEYPLDSVQNKIARLLISKILLNSPDSTLPGGMNDALPNESEATASPTSGTRLKSNRCMIDLKMRRRLALMIYAATNLHHPEDNEFGPQSLGATVEVAFGELNYDQGKKRVENLLELAVDPSYQQFYVWAWRILFTLRVHILNQPETDWNDIQSRSGTSRSIKNTVLVNDNFHPVPSIQDFECLSLSDGVRSRTNPMASFIYLMMTDATWQLDTLASCLDHLNILASSGHITPSLMAMKFLTICHLNNLQDVMVRDKQYLDYFHTIICSNIDVTRIASLIVTQFGHLKQYRQLQLSQFYITRFLEVAALVLKQISSSWFSNHEVNFEKIACILDYIVRMNFATQSREIIKKFYECSYSVSDTANAPAISNWFGSFFSSSSSSPVVTPTIQSTTTTPNNNGSASTKRDHLTILHALTQKFRKYFWLRWVTIECDALKLEKQWEDIVVFMSCNEETQLDLAIKRVCPQANGTLLKSTLPIFSWIKLIFDIMESDLNHQLCPLVWYNFFVNYFANSLNGVSVGFKLISSETLTKLITRLDSLFNYHLYKRRNWNSTSATQQSSLAQLYKAYKLWLQDESLRDAYIDIDRLKPEYQVSLLKAVMESSNEDACVQYMDIESIQVQLEALMQRWILSTRLVVGNPTDVYISRAIENLNVATPDDEASDAVSLIAQSYATTSAELKTSPYYNGDEELSKPLREDLLDRRYKSVDELMQSIKRDAQLVSDESVVFDMNLVDLDKIHLEIIELVQQLYSNKKREFIHAVACVDGIGCTGAAKIKLEAEEAYMDERKSQCIHDRQRQCQELVGELLLMPKNRTVQSVVIVEECVKRLLDHHDQLASIIESLLAWIGEPNVYSRLNGNYHVANYLLKSILEILMETEQLDTFNTALIDVCLSHPDGVTIFSPYLSPSSCSSECFLKLYKTICMKQSQLEPKAIFVILSKFDMSSWLNLVKSNHQILHDAIATTCSALRQFGKQVDELCEPQYDLFKRHMQIQLAAPERRKSREISLVFGHFLSIMDDQMLVPSLWDELMAIIGLDRDVKHRSRDDSDKHERNSMPTPSANAVGANASLISRTYSLLSSPRKNSHLHINNSAVCLLDSHANNADEQQQQLQPNEDMPLNSVIDDVARLADTQSIFDYRALDKLMKMFSEFLTTRHNNSPDKTLLEVYADYLDNFSIVMLSLTFMWIKSMSDEYPDNHQIMWTQFMALWYDWVFLTKNCQNVGKSSYSLVVNYFVASLRYMIYKSPDSTHQILRSILANLVDYVHKAKEIVYLELTILQRCLKDVPWSSLIAQPEDIENMASLSEQNNYNVSDLVSHLMVQMNMKHSMDKIYENSPELMPHVAERLATVIILQSTNLKSYRLHGRYFSIIAEQDLQKLASLILSRMEYVNLEHNQNNKLLVNLLRFMCIRMKTFDGQQQQHTSGTSTPTTNIPHELATGDQFNRSLVYAQFVSNYLVDLIKRHPNVTKLNSSYIFAVMDNSLADLKQQLLSPVLNLRQKTIIYESLLECCSNESIDRQARLLLSRTLIESNLVKNQPLVMMEILYACGQIVRDAQILVNMIERLIIMYMSIDGHYEKVWKSFCLRVLPSDLYLNACIEHRASLALVVYFESLARGSQNELPTSMSNHHLIQPHQPKQRPRDEQQPQMPTNDNDNISTCSSLTSERTTSSASYNTNRIWSSMFHWSAQLIASVDAETIRSGSNLTATDDVKLIVVWLRMLDMLWLNLQTYLLDPIGRPNPNECAIDNEPNTGVRDNQRSSTGNNSNNDKQQQPDEINCNEDAKKSQAERQLNRNSSLASSYLSAIGGRMVGSSSGANLIAPQMISRHRMLVEFIKQLVNLYESIDSVGLWSYLRASAASSGARNDQQHSTKFSLIALAVASFLTDRSNLLLQSETQGKEQPSQLVALQDEVTKLRRTCLSKLETARKTKSYLDHMQFIETLIEIVQRNERVRYREGVQLISTFVSTFYCPAKVTHHIPMADVNQEQPLAWLVKMLPLDADE